MTKPKKAANLARTIWRTAGRCENPKCDQPIGRQLHGAHILGVGSHLRVCADLRNGVCLCSVCHRRFHDNHFDFDEFVQQSAVWGYMEAVREASRTGIGPKIDWDAQIEFLKDIKKRIEGGELTLAQAREKQNRLASKRVITPH